MSKPFLFLIALLSVSPFSYAGSTSLVTLKDFQFMPNGVVVAYVDGRRHSPPACATEATRFAIDAATPAGKVQLVGLLSAYSLGKSISIYGKSTCTFLDDTESINYFNVPE